MRNRIYIIVLGVGFIREELTKFLDTIVEVQDWFYSMPSSIFVVSSLGAEDLYQRIQAKFGQKRFFITELSQSNRQGWMPTEHWTKIGNAR